YPQRGAGLVEVMVGVTVALFATLVIYVVVGSADRLRRDSQSAGDAQQTGLFVLSRIGFDIANAGSGFASAAKALSTCPASTNVADTLRPIAVLIGDSGRDDVPDSVAIRYAVTAAIAGPATFAAAAPAGANFLIQSPYAFAVGDRIIAVGRNGECEPTDVISSVTSAPGVVEVVHAPLATAFAASSWLIDLGAVNDAQVIRYDVQSNVLRTTDLLNGDTPNPLASNIVNLKLQYGIDSDGDGTLDSWVPARSGPLGDWSTTALLMAPADVLSRIKAIRVALIVRSDFVDRGIKTTFDWTLFDCEAIDKSSCPGRLSGSVAPTTAGGYRYRLHETVVPLRNTLWNR
ncbi:MAG TPA: PilW family protein, partial [Casimicrobiaceae bacterium]